MTVRDNKKKKINSPNPITYGFARFALMILAPLFMDFKIKRDPRIAHLKGPIIALGTHSCMMDVAFSILSVNNRRLNVVCGKDVLTWKWLKGLRSGLRMIPINQYEIDLKSIKDMKNAVDSGCSLSLFPEGKITLDGRNLFYLNDSLAKLLKFLKANVVFLHTSGGFCARPRWYHGFKRGKVVSTSELLFKKEEICNMSNSEIYAILKDRFTYNDNLYQVENNLRFRSKCPARGLDFILYKCPKCGAEYNMENDGQNITCQICGNTVNYDEYGNITSVSDGAVAFSRIDLWYDFQREAVRKEIMQPDMELNKEVIWKRINYKKGIYETVGEGRCYVNKEFIGFEGKDLSGNDVSFKCSIIGLYTIIVKTNEGIDLTIDHVVNRLMFKEKKYSIKYNLIVEEFFRLANNIP